MQSKSERAGAGASRHSGRPSPARPSPAVRAVVATVVRDGRRLSREIPLIPPNPTYPGESHLRFMCRPYRGPVHVRRAGRLGERWGRPRRWSARRNGKFTKRSQFPVTHCFITNIGALFWSRLPIGTPGHDAVRDRAEKCGRGPLPVLDPTGDQAGQRVRHQGVGCAHRPPPFRRSLCAKALQLRMVPVSRGLAPQYRLGEQGFPPQRDQRLGIEMLRMEAPEAHATNIGLAARGCKQRLVV